MMPTEGIDRVSPEGSWWQDRVASMAIVGGGVVMTVLFVAFTLAHGPTSVNVERHILGWDMHAWGFLLGVLPNLLIASGLWRLRRPIAAGRRGATTVVVVCSVALLLDALMNLAFRALGPPFILFVLAPAIVALAALIPANDAASTRVRVAVAALGAVLATGLVLALIPQATSDSFDGYRIFGTVVYGLGGLLWALLGISLQPRGTRAACETARGL